MLVMPFPSVPPDSLCSPSEHVRVLVVPPSAGSPCRAQVSGAEMGHLLQWVSEHKSHQALDVTGKPRAEHRSREWERCLGSLEGTALSCPALGTGVPVPQQCVSPTAPQAAAQGGDGAIPQLCVTSSNDTLRSLSSQCLLSRARVSQQRHLSLASGGDWSPGVLNGGTPHAGQEAPVLTMGKPLLWATVTTGAMEAAGGTDPGPWVPCQ